MGKSKLWKGDIQLIRICAIFFAFLLGANSAIAEKCSAYEFKLDLPSNEYYSGDLINVDIKIINSSHVNLDIPSALDPQDYWLNFYVVYNGSKLVYVGPERKLKNPYGFLSIRPGYYYGRSLVLNEYFNINEPGKYTLQVIYGIGPDLTEINQGKCTEHLVFNVK